MDPFNEKYEIVDKIGEGSFAEVLKCVDKNTGEKFAAKRLKKSFVNFEDAFNSAELIATQFQMLTLHPNVLNMLEYYYSPKTGSLIFIFELMDSSIYDYLQLRKRPIPEMKVQNFMYQILKGVAHLHDQGIFHRDIKPENILIKKLVNYKFDLMKVADFGSIRGIHTEQPYTGYISTRWYRSPECLLTDGYYGPKMDIWAIGCVFYEMLTLKPLFPGANEIDQLAKIHHILGTPNIRFMHKLKNRSQNFEHFPRTKGIGLSLLIMPYVSDDALRLLRSMLQYNPDNRINVRRLIDSKYFGLYRHNDLHLKLNAPYVEPYTHTVKTRTNLKPCAQSISAYDPKTTKNPFSSRSFFYPTPAASKNARLTAQTTNNLQSARPRIRAAAVPSQREKRVFPLRRDSSVASHAKRIIDALRIYQQQRLPTSPKKDTTSLPNQTPLV